MLFLADEDFPGIGVRWLRDAGHDVIWARTHMPGKADSELLAAAQRDSRVVLTCDKDFGELAFHSSLPWIACLEPLRRFSAGLSICGGHRFASSRSFSARRSPLMAASRFRAADLDR